MSAILTLIGDLFAAIAVSRGIKKYKDEKGRKKGQ